MRRLLLACAVLLPGLAAQAACPPDAAVAQLAEAMIAGRPADPPAGLSLADAECARDRLVPLLEPVFGSGMGYKVGLTSAASQRRYGLAQPVRGTLFEAALAQRNGSEITLAPPLSGLVVEPDLLVRVRDAGINTAGRDHVEILRHLDQVIPFIELPRNPFSRQPDGPGLVAGNVAARLGVVGAPMAVEATPEFARRLGNMTVVFSDGTREIARAPGSALSGHPLDVIPWLVQDLARSGLTLGPRDFISLGGFAPSVPAEPGHGYTVRYEGLADMPVSLSVRFR